MKFIKALVFASSLLISNLVLANALSVDHAYLRATPPHAANSAAFMTIHNNSEATIKLLDATSDIAARVELHSHTMDDGMMKMRQVKSIEIKANSEVMLQPGGYHIMFLGLKEKLIEGESAQVTLHFDNDQSITVNLPIKKTKMMKH